ncbi:MAG: hypothetical protein ABEJ66_01535, partial [Candidatus Nanohaloarchaea archaeon]
MGYYDSVKDSVEEEDSRDEANFETLRKAAEESSEPDDEREGDDTDIEILEEGISEDAPGKTQKEKKKEQRQQESQGSGPDAAQSQDSSPGQQVGSQDAGSPVDTGSGGLMDSSSA